MGIIQKQGTRSSFFLLIGFIIGGINTLILFPKVLTQAEYGLTRAIIDTATILSILATLGSTSVIYKFFPFYRSHTENRKNDLPFISGMTCLIGFLLILAVLFLFKDFIIRKLGKSPLFAENFNLVIPATLLMLVFIWLEAFGWSYKKTVATNFLKETLVRFLTTLLILALAAQFIDTHTFFSLFPWIYALPVLILWIILQKTGQWHFHRGPSRVTRRFGPKMATFALFIFGASFLNILSRTVDSFMIIGLKGLEKTAVFTIATYLVTFMDLPFRGLNAIATPILSESWKHKDYRNIATIYEKSTITLLIAGLFIYLLVVLNISNLIRFLGPEWEQAAPVVMIMGLAKLIDLGTGVNGQIIGTSINWRFDFFTNVLLTMLAFPLNFLLIRQFGIIGAAFSNLGALLIYNGIRFAFIYKKYGWQPYRLTHAWILLTACLVFGLVWILPFLGNLYVDTLLKSSIFALIFLILIYRFRFSEEINQNLQKILKPWFPRWFS